MSVQERNKTVDEVLLKPVKRQFATLEALLDRCLPTLAARLWATCGWPESMAWKVGDFNFLVLEAIPEPDARIYIQFWSEPLEMVSAEVSSGEWSPGTLKYLRAERRRQLKAFGFEIGGRAKNFQKSVRISTSQEAEAVAREALQILFEVFGYRGQWPLTLQHHEGQRADLAHTYSSLTPEDFAKLVQWEGWSTAIAPEDDPADGVRAVLLRHGRRESIAILEDRVPKTLDVERTKRGSDAMKTLFSSLLLGGLLCVLAPASDAQRVHASGHYGSYGSRGSYRYAPRYESSRVWIPGGYQTVNERVWVPGRVERVWVDPVFELRVGSCGERFRVLVSAGHWRTIEHPGHYEVRRVRVHVPGRWEKRC